MMGGPAGREADYAALIAGLAMFRLNDLQGRPSDRALAAAAEVSPTTIGEWLRGVRFPQQVDPLLKLVRALRVQAESVGLAGASAGVLLEGQRWRRAYQAEAHRRANTTRTAVEAGQGRAVLERMRPGRPLSEVTDPFHLEVHHAINSPAAGLPMLPTYVPREHDRAVAEVVAQAADGTSQIAVLVGGSSTGKTRACWEALHVLRERDEPWRLWHPINPTRPGAALDELADIAPYTVIWLNEAQEYLTPEQFGDQVAAGLRSLLRDSRRAPVLVLATLWPDHWKTLTTRAMPDPHAQARELLDGHKIKVPDAFTDDDLAALIDTARRDPRLGEAVDRALDGHITQYLAGVPVLLDLYQAAPPATRALIDAAMDARRLGAGQRIPLAWLADAAPGYLTDMEWDHTGDDWLERALAYVTTPCNGIPGILTSAKTGAPRNQRNRPTTGHPSTTGQGLQYRLADYLDQHSRRHRAEQLPPVDFWTAAAVQKSTGGSC
ncbi:XRE family transcriptional regulator, partial [Streptomyces sp. uw30]